jgi:hypothetical protein
MTIEEIVEQVRNACYDAAEEIGGRIEDDLAIHLNTPYPPASNSGDYPARRTGRLRAGLRHDTSRTETGAETVVSSIREPDPEKKGESPNVPGILRDSGRDYIGFIRAEWESRLTGAVKDLFDARFK